MKQNKEDSEFVLPGHFVGLKFREGWWFFHALMTETIELKPWILLNENNDRAEIGPQTAGSEDEEFRDVVGRKYLTPQESERDLVYQLQLGIAPSRIQLYPVYGRKRTPNLRGTAEPGEPQVWLNGYDSPYNNPSDEAEVFMLNNQENLSLQAYNPTSEPLEARLSVHVNKIKYGTVTDRGLMKAMLQGQQPAKKHQMGLGVRSNDQLKAPAWLKETFGNHLYTTDEILSADAEQSGTINYAQGGSR